MMKLDVTCKNKQVNKFKMNVLKRADTSQNGITLIALIITIIILIILAGITINLTVGDNGIFSKAKYAKKMTEDTQWVENAQIIALEAKMNKNEIQKLTDEEIKSANRRRNKNRNFKTRKNVRLFNKKI